MRETPSDSTPDCRSLFQILKVFLWVSGGTKVPPDTLRLSCARTMDRSDTRNGFSLLELLIVVAIILIIASIAVPNLLRSRQSANEAGAVSTLRAVNGAQTTYLSTNGVFGTFVQLSADGMIDARFSANGALVGGYTYSVYGGGTNDYRVSAIVSGTQSRYNYYTGTDNIVRYRDAAPGETLPAGISAGDPLGS